MAHSSGEIPEPTPIRGVNFKQNIAADPKNNCDINKYTLLFEDENFELEWNHFHIQAKKPALYIGVILLTMLDAKALYQFK